MKIKFFFLLSFVVLLSSCVSQKQFTELQALQKSTNDALNSATIELNSCNPEEDPIRPELDNDFRTSYGRKFMGENSKMKFVL